jgi:hypothetical protein
LAGISEDYMKSSGTDFVVPFSAGTLVGIIGGLVLGTIIGQRLLGLTIQLIAHLLGDGDEPRFDLLAQ